MKVIIAGSRDIDDPQVVRTAIVSSGWTASITEVVCGGARGVDTVGENLAKSHGVAVKKFPADWDKFGKAAGMIRNREMAQYADALIAIWDGTSRGTKGMISEMEKLNKPVFVLIKKKAGKENE